MEMGPKYSLFYLQKIICRSVNDMDTEPSYPEIFLARYGLSVQGTAPGSMNATNQELIERFENDKVQNDGAEKS